MFLLLSALYFFHTRLSTAAPITPVANLTALETVIAPGWVENPSGRGTWGLLYSCLFTLLLCVYTAIHLNVPPKKDTNFKFWLRKTKWVAIAIFAPEIVVYVAFEQWFLARKFLIKLRKIASESTDEKFKSWNQKDGKTSQFDMVYAHYVVMGGFAGTVTDIHNSLERVTYTPEGVLFLAQHGRFCQVLRTDIEDKSKADVLAKGLVCVQVLWIAGQALERKITGYPVTLLEVHTIVHVFCALFMYLLWFQKPLNVQDPTIINLEEDNDLLAFLLQLSSTKTKTYKTDFSSLLHPSSQHRGFKSRQISTSLWKKEEPEFWWYNSPLSLHREVENADDLPIIQPAHQKPQQPLSLKTYYSYTISSNTGGPTEHYPVGGIDKFYAPTSKDAICCRIFSGQALPSGMGLAFPYWSRGPAPRHNNKGPAFGEFVNVVSLSAKDIKRLELVAKAVKRELVPESARNPNVDLKSTLLLLCDFYNWHDPPLSLRSTNFTGKVFGFLQENSAYLCAGMVLIPAGYGSVHLAALDIMFPTDIERLLWQISCYYLVGAAGFIALAIFLVYADRMIFLAWKRFLKDSRANNTPFFMGPIPKRPGPFVRYILARRYVLSCESVGFQSAVKDKYKIRSPANYVYHILGMPFSRLSKTTKGFCAVVSACLLLFVVGAAVIVYMGARLYIVVESFISLRHVPIGVYRTPKLNIFGNIPHL